MMSLPSNVVLREVQAEALPLFFEHQQDPEANYVAAFTAKDPTDQRAFMAHWTRIFGRHKHRHSDHPLRGSGGWLCLGLRGNH